MPPLRVWFNRTFSSIHSALDLIRQGDEEGRYTLVCSSPAIHPSVRAFCHECHDEPRGLNGAQYVQWCLEFCEREHIDIFVPGRSASAIAKEGGLFLTRGTRVMLSANSATMALLHDKAAFYDIVRSAHAPAPQWIVCANASQFDQAVAVLEKECSALCVKPAQSVYGIGFRRIRTDRTPFELLLSADQYQIDMSSLRSALHLKGQFEPLLVMEYLGGAEFSVDCLADHGDLMCAIPRRKPCSSEIGQYIDPREDVYLACADIVRQFRLNGYVNIQFRDGDHGLRVLEVNARMSGGIALACLAGPNLPYLGLAGFERGYAAVEIPPVRHGVRVMERNIAFEVPAC